MGSVSFGAASVDEWLRTLVFSNLNHSSSHHCALLGSHVRHAKFCLRVVRVFVCLFFVRGDLFSPHLMAQNEWNNFDRLLNRNRKKIFPGKTEMRYVAEIPSVEVICGVKYKGNVLFWLGFEGNFRQKKKIGVFTVNRPSLESPTCVRSYFPQKLVIRHQKYKKYKVCRSC